MSQFDKARELIESQFKKIHQDIARNKEIRDLADAQFFEKQHDEHLYPMYFKMPESNRSNWKILDTKTRMVYVLCKSRAFSLEEIGNFIGVNKMYVSRLYRSARSKLKPQ